MKFYSPRFVTETDEPAPWTDCTWASGLMFANKASLGKYPATRKEREALRAASGDHIGGSNLGNLRDGIKARYHWIPILDGPSWQTLLSRLQRGDGAVVQGLYSNLTDHFQRWDRAFADKPNPSHAAYVQGHDRGGNQHISGGLIRDVFWEDPLGRSPAGTPPAERYRGEWMPIAVLHNFIRGLDTTDAQLSFVVTVQQGWANR